MLDSETRLALLARQVRKAHFSLQVAREADYLDRLRLEPEAEEKLATAETLLLLAQAEARAASQDGVIEAADVPALSIQNIPAPKY
jgi:hypothetical protein